MGNKPAWDYYQKTRSQFKDVTQPLIDLGLADFGYWRIYEDGTYHSWVNDESFMETYFQRVKSQGEFFCRKFEETPDDKHYFMLDGDISQYDRHTDIIPHMAWDYGYWNALIMFIPNEAGYIDCYDFISTRESRDMSSFFLTNMGRLEKFRDYFQVSISKLDGFHDIGNRGKLIDEFSFKIKSKENQMVASLENFLSSFIKVKHSLITQGREVILTSREEKCLSLLLEHKTAKEIARDMNVSHRTVETYLHNMRRKAGVSSKSALIQMVK